MRLRIWSMMAGLLILGILGMGSFYFVKRLSAAPLIQEPLPFSHKVHMAPKQHLKCTSCHPEAETTPYAGIVKLWKCMQCHDVPQGKNPEEPLLRKYYKKGKEFHWIQVNRLPGDVYFSHAMHVTVAKIKCQYCHGQVQNQNETITIPTAGKITMHECIECHEQKGARISCGVCHQ